jgi:hypothetical protein
MTETCSQKAERLPSHNKPVWVKCDGFRCLAIMDNNGKWKTVFGGKELPGNIEVVDLPEPKTLSGFKTAPSGFAHLWHEIRPKPATSFSDSN